MSAENIATNGCCGDTVTGAHTALDIGMSDRGRRESGTSPTPSGTCKNQTSSRQYEGTGITVGPNLAVARADLSGHALGQREARRVIVSGGGRIARTWKHMYRLRPPGRMAVRIGPGLAPHMGRDRVPLGGMPPRKVSTGKPLRGGRRASASETCARPLGRS